MNKIKEEFLQSLTELLPADEARQLYVALGESEPSVSVRVNARKGDGIVDNLERVAWCEGGYYLPQRRSFTFDPLFHAGAYYVQDASSMFISHVIKSLVTKPVRYLDLCAAPGGKTTAAIDALPPGSLVVANEIVSSRARTLADNVMKWGAAATVVTGDSPERIGRLTHFFDIVAADVPCSGEGMMRKDSQAAEQWSPRLVGECAERQRSIIDDIWEALRPGGLFIYSTCTFNRQENEQIVEYIIEKYSAEPISVDIDPSWNIHQGIATEAPCYHFFPHKTRGEGLFMAVLKKPEGQSNAIRGKRPATVAQARGEWERWLNDDADCAFLAEKDGRIIAFPRQWLSELKLLQEKCHLIGYGIEVALSKGRKIVPSHSLAMSIDLNRQAFARAEVDLSTAIAYLRGESITLNNATRGFILITYQGRPLGFVNNLGNRANNLYPKPLRILSTHIPDSVGL